MIWSEDSSMQSRSSMWYEVLLVIDSNIEIMAAFQSSMSSAEASGDSWSDICTSCFAAGQTKWGSTLQPQGHIARSIHSNKFYKISHQQIGEDVQKTLDLFGRFPPKVLVQISRTVNRRCHHYSAPGLFRSSSASSRHRLAQAPAAADASAPGPARRASKVPSHLQHKPALLPWV